MSHPQPRVSVIVLAWPPGQSRSRNIRTFLDSLPAGLEWPELQVIVLQNGADSALGTALRGDQRISRLIESEVNLGVASGWNFAASLAVGDLLVLANEDLVLGASTLAELVHPLRQRQVGLVATKVGPWSRDRVRPAKRRHHGNARRDDEVMVPAGFLMALRRSTWEEVGGVEGRLSPASFEEVDLAFRVAAAGLQTVAVGSLGTEHEYGVSTYNRAQTISWSGGIESVAQINRRNHRLMVKRWSSQRWRGSGLGHLLLYWGGVCRWRAAQSVALIRRFWDMARTTWSRLRDRQL